MSADLASVLEDCIERTARGEELEACLARYPEQADELKVLLGAAARLEAGSLVQPSPAFKAQARRQLLAHMAAHPRARLKIRVKAAPRFSPLSRLGLGLAVCLATFLVTTTALAQYALPGGALYFWKLTSEQAWQIVSADRPGVELALAGRRVDEAVAVSGDVKAQKIALEGYQKIVSDLQQYTDPTVQQRIQATLQNQATELKNAGLTNISSPTRVPQTSSASSPHGAGAIRGPNKNPTATPVLKFPDVFGH